MSWQKKIPDKTLEWLLESEDPGARYLTLKNLANLSEDDPNLISAQERAYSEGPLKTVLDAMHPDGYWEEAGPGYLPKYRSTVWSLILLAQLGASVKDDSRIGNACTIYLDAALTDKGQISANGAPSGTSDCLQGNILSSMLDLEFSDPRLESAFDWMARTVTGEGVSPMEEKKAPLRYYSGKIGPDFQCGANNKLSCAWGGTKVMLAFSKIPEEMRTPLIRRAIQKGIDFLFSTDPAEAGYPNGWNLKPSGNWWKFGFPVFYVSDILQIAEVLVSLGYGRDPRLANTIQLITEKQDPNGKWALEYGYSGKTWIDFGPKKEPNKWVTIRAYQVLNKIL
ncbi:MAG: hypothetical protein KAS84_05195 [Anaerolineales bacterium]|nr:hypothetical protein [Anaerolineales bacterium]